MTTPTLVPSRTAESPPAQAFPEYRVVGRPVAHHDFVDKVEGSLQYAADWDMPGMLYGKVVRAQVPSARLLSVDVKMASAVRGVVVVLVADDVPHNVIISEGAGGLGELEIPMPVLASDRIRYVGEPIALVAATSVQAAEEAAELVEVDYEELPGVFDTDTAQREDAPRVHDKGNVLVSWQVRRGDVETAMAEADAVVEGTYQSQRVEHAYLEPEAGVAWIENGVVTLRVATQVIEHGPEIAHILGLPASKVRVIATYMGGGFGGKEDMTVEPYLALLAWRTRRPVKLVFERQESIVATTKRHPFTMRYRTGVRHDGTIVAQEVDVTGDAGAYPYLSARVLFAAAATACGPYRVPNAAIVSRAVLTNQVPTSAFRGFGAMQVTFAYEAQMDLIAKRLGRSPIEVRQRNFLEQGDMLPTGEVVDTCVEVSRTMREVLERLGPRTSADDSSAPHIRIGRGFACNRQPYGRTVWFRDRASAWLSLEPDGTLLLRSGVTDLGGGQAASLCQIAAEIVGVPLDDISVYIGDSALNPPAGGTFATRQLFMSGNAVVRAASDLKAKLVAVAADILGASEDELVFAEGRVRATGSLEPYLTLAELVAECERREVPTAVMSTWHAPVGTFDPREGQGHTFPDYTYGTHAAEVAVDMETGEVKVLRYVACHDVGRMINPLRVEGQVQGGVMQGLGYALSEEVPIVDGVPGSMLFADYLVPNSYDFPDVEVVVVESGEGKGPLGARGIGEPSIGNTAAAIASAIEDAIGVRPTVTPITPERVLAMLDRARADAPGGPGPGEPSP